MRNPRPDSVLPPTPCQTATRRKNPLSPAICRYGHTRGGWQGMEDGLQSRQERNPPSPAICRYGHPRGGWQGMEDGLQTRQERNPPSPAICLTISFPARTGAIAYLKTLQVKVSRDIHQLACFSAGHRQRMRSWRAPAGPPPHRHARTRSGYPCGLPDCHGGACTLWHVPRKENCPRALPPHGLPGRARQWRWLCMVWLTGMQECSNAIAHHRLHSSPKRLLALFVFHVRHSHY